MGLIELNRVATALGIAVEADLSGICCAFWEIASVGAACFSISCFWIVNCGCFLWRHCEAWKALSKSIREKIVDTYKHSYMLLVPDFVVLPPKPSIFKIFLGQTIRFLLFCGEIKTKPVSAAPQCLQIPLLVQGSAQSVMV